MPVSGSSITRPPKAASAGFLREFASDVRRGLSKPQKELHSKYLYDDLGSALFEAITRLPEYGLTRADARLLNQHAVEIAQFVARPVSIIELGSGTGEKTRPILTALSGSRYFPIDVSADALDRCQHELSSVAEVYPLQQVYFEGMASAMRHRRTRESLLVLFLGSTIGNFERPCALEFLRELRGYLDPGDSLLIGADLVKERDRMLAAYDDPTGVTAAFNLNMLGRINRELGGRFDLHKFEHQARWNEQDRRIEMHLCSRVDQIVGVEAASFGAFFRAGETIWTESSHKFHAEEMMDMAGQTGFQVQAQWIDREWPFVESLWTAL